MNLNEIKQPVEEQMESFEAYFRQQMNSPKKILQLVTDHILRHKGKQLRPLLVFLSAKCCGEISDSTYSAATLIELLHTASLVHDDIVDEAQSRRGQISINALMGNKIAVLVGDFYLSRGLLVALENNHYDVLRIVSEAVRDLSEGELQQIEHTRNLDITEQTYFEVIRKKTATLISACTRAGAYSSGAKPEIVEAMKNYGENLGIAFQIRDDIADLEKTNLFGKPTGNDIKEKKLTLPILHCLEGCPAKEKSQILSVIKHHSKEKSTAEIVNEFIEKYKGVDYARKIMLDYAQKAKRALDIIPDSQSKTSLIELVDYNTIRKE